jgi:hypothetical protein
MWVGYFKNIYKREEHLQNLRGPNTINEFLGEDVLNKNEVRNTKLSEQ